MVAQVLILVLLILLNAFFAGSEIAFISLNSNKLRNLAEDGNKKAMLVLKLKENSTRFLSTIQIGVSLASMLSGVFASEAFAQILAAWIISLGIGASEVVIRSVSMVLITLITSYLILVFGELVPKRIAMTNSEKFAFAVVYPVSVLSSIALPLVRLLSLSTNLILRMVGIDPNKAEEEVTEEEIRIMVDAGEIQSAEKQMINNIFEFDNHEVADIMTHRTDVVGIDVLYDFKQIMEIVNNEQYTRYPVYEDSIDNIVGVLHLRDILSYLNEEQRQEFDIKKVIRVPYFVPDSKLTNELFNELQANKTHLAVVIDEYGGTAGIVTLEDLIEEIMGSIMDEYDEEEESDIIEVFHGEYLVEGACDLEDLEEVLNIGLPIDNYDTVSGFVIGELGRIPSNDDVISSDSDVTFNGYRFSIIEVEEKVVGRVRIVKEKQAGHDLFND